MIPHRGALFLVKRRSLARRLSASKPLFVAPTGLRYLPRLRPHLRLDLHPRRAHYGFPSPVASFRFCPLLSKRTSQFNLSTIERLQASLVSHARLRHLPRPRLLPHLDLLSRCPWPTPVLTLPPSSPSTMSSASYRSSSATSTPAPLLRSSPRNYNIPSAELAEAGGSGAEPLVPDWYPAACI